MVKCIFAKKTMLKTFKIIALLEGVSLLALLFFAMPLKYLWDEPIYVKTIGMAHGILFIAYVILALMLKIEYNWKLKKLFIVFIASVIPFGTFYVEKKYLNNN
jgi:integral membrane protein